MSFFDGCCSWGKTDLNVDGCVRLLRMNERPPRLVAERVRRQHLANHLGPEGPGISDHDFISLLVPGGFHTASPTLAIRQLR